MKLSRKFARLLTCVCLGLVLGVQARADEPARSQRSTNGWTLPEVMARLHRQPQDSYLQFVALQLANREGRMEDIAREIENAQPPGDFGTVNSRRTVDLFSIFTGALAVQESLQLDTMRNLGSGRRLPQFRAEAPAGPQAAASALTPVKLRELSGQETLTLKGHNYPITSIALSQDGRQLASASQDNTIKLWDSVTGREALTLKGHAEGVTSVAFSPDGKRLASGSEDKTIKLWDSATGQETLTLKGHLEPVRSVAFSADGKRLASASWDKTIKIWEAAVAADSNSHLR